MAAAVLRRGHSVAFLDANRADDSTVRRYDIVFAGLGRDLARCQLVGFHLDPSSYLACAVPPSLYVFCSILSNHIACRARYLHGQKC